MSTELAATNNPLMAVLSDPERLQTLDVDKLERLAELHMQMLARDAELAYGVALNALQSELTPVKKRGVNSQTASRYALLEDIERMLDPLIVKHGFSMSVSTGTSEKEDHTKYVAIVRHTGGHKTTHEIDAPFDDVGMKGSRTKTRIHGMSSARSYCKRILKSEIFDVTTTKDDDGNAAGGIGPSAECITPDQVDDLRAMLEEVGANEDRFLVWLRVSKLEEIPASQHTAAVRALEAKRASQ